MNVEALPIDGHDLQALRRAYPQVFARPRGTRFRRAAILLGIALFVVFCFWRIGFFDLARFIAGLGRLGLILGLMVPPTPAGALLEMVNGIFETLAMALLGTTIAALAAVPIGMLAAKNVIPGWLLHFSLRRALDGIRGIDALIWALIFVHVVGLGPFAGILALAVSDTGTLSKLYAEAIENVNPKPIEGLRATGANRLQVMRFAILPQVFPVMLSNALYFFESNTRSATILGIVGAGGIGLQLSDRIRLNAWDEAAFIILIILATVTLIDLLSARIQRRFIVSAGRRG